MGPHTMTTEIVTGAEVRLHLSLDCELRQAFTAVQRVTDPDDA